MENLKGSALSGDHGINGRTILIFLISYIQSGDYKEYYFLRCNAVYLDRNSLMFRKTYHINLQGRRVSEARNQQ
jgi:hypothetical protein